MNDWIEHPWEREDREIREAFEKKDAEIERLKAEFQKAKEWNQLSEIQIKNLQEIVEAQSDLLTRAADALAYEMMSRHAQLEIRDNSALVAELREAAQ